MRATVTASGLNSTAAWLTKVIPIRPTVPILGGVVLDVTSDADRDEVTVSAFDYDTYGAARLDTGVITVDTPGRVVVSGRLLASLAKTLGNGDDPVVLDAPDGASSLAVTVGRSRWSLPLMRVQDYPQTPTNGQQVGTVGARALADAIGRVIDAVDLNSAVPELTAVAVMSDGDELRLVATDKYRLAVVELPWKAEGTLDTIVAPTALLRFAATAMADEDGPAGVHLDGGAVGFSLPTRTIVGRLMGGKYLRWQQLDVTPDSPKSTFTTAAVLPVANLRAAVARAAVMLEGSATLRVTVTKHGVRVAAAGDSGDTEHVADLESFDGEDVAVNLNPGYLRDALDGVGTDRVRLDLSARYRPVLVRPLDDQGELIRTYRHYVMPVKDASPP